MLSLPSERHLHNELCNNLRIQRRKGFPDSRFSDGGRNIDEDSDRYKIM